MSRPTVTVYSCDTGLAVGNPLPLPAVFNAPIRNDVVQQTFSLMNKNRRQAHGVYFDAGHQTSAESWGTGRAVARIPRVAGGGTHRAGQGAFGNMCRGGSMFAPNKTWRKWQRRINVNLKRYAVSSAVAATSVLGLVLARGHKVAHLPEIPLVVSTESMNTITKTKQAVAALKKLGAYGDVERVIASRKLRAGKGKMRNRRHTQRLGPLVIFKESKTLPRVFRNIPGVELCKVERLNLLKLAPGGHLGRFVIWTSDAFAALDTVFSSKAKTGFVLPHAKLSNASLTRILRSEEVLSKLRHRLRVRRAVHKKNPLVNLGAMLKLNPYMAVLRRHDVLRQRAFENARARIKKLASPAGKAAKAALKKAAHDARKKRRTDPAHKKAVQERKAAKAKKQATKKTAKPVTKAAPKKEVVPGKKPVGKKHALRGLLSNAARKRRVTKTLNRKNSKARSLFTKLLFS